MEVLPSSPTTDLFSGSGIVHPDPLLDTESICCSHVFTMSCSGRLLLLTA